MRLETRSFPALAQTIVLWAPDTAGPWSAVTIKHISMNWQAYFGSLSKKEAEVIYCKENTRQLVLDWTVSCVLGACMKVVEQRGSCRVTGPSVHPSIFDFSEISKFYSVSTYLA